LEIPEQIVPYPGSNVTAGHKAKHHDD